jgi:ribosome biogenesis GTPase
VTRQEKRNLKDITKLEKQRERQKYINTAAVLKTDRPPRVRLDTRTEDWDEEAPIASVPRRATPPAPTVTAATEEGVVTGIGPRICRLYSDGKIVTCTALPGLAVGDRVLFGAGAARKILPRRTTLSRPDPHNPRLEKMLAANVDVVVNVVSVASPPLRPGLIDRYLVAIQRGGAEPLICVNKIDLLQDGGELDALDAYRAVGVPVVLCSAATGVGIPELLEILSGRTCVFTGHSGVGKSSVLNTICPELGLATHGVSAVHNKGQHTTTSSSLHFLPNGTRVIDTPGIREFGLWEISQAELPGYFNEFSEYSGACAYGDCTHTHEPDCAVRDAVSREQIPRARFEAYLRMRATLES